MEKDLTTGNVGKILIKFSLPYLLSMFLQTFYGLADLFIIGQFCGKESTTAVSLGGQVMHMLTVIIVGLAMGSTVMIGRHVGEKDRERVNKTVGNTIVLFAVVSLVLTAILMALTSRIITLIKTPSEAMEEMWWYLKICFAGIPFITAYNIISSMFRGMGDTKRPMIFVAVACVLNVGLDYIFIGYMGMGPKGAALGTTISQSVSVIVALISIWKKKMFPGFGKMHLKPIKSEMKDILKIGLPISAQDGFVQVAFVLISVFANIRGINDAAAVGVVEKFIGILFMVPSTLSAAVSALCAQNFGAEKPERAKKTLKTALIIAVGIGFVFSVVFQFASEWGVSLFTKDEDVIVLGGQYLRAYVFDCVFAAIHFIFSGYFCALGKSGISFWHNMASVVLARIPIAWYASKKCASLFPMGIAAPIGSIISIIICVIAYVIIEKRKR